MKKVFLFLVLLSTVCYFAGCGRVSKPTAPDGSTYPHGYIVKDN